MARISSCGCGHTHRPVLHYDGEHFFIRCSGCKCRTSDFTVERHAIQDWNQLQRHLPECIGLEPAR